MRNCEQRESDATRHDAGKTGAPQPRDQRGREGTAEDRAGVYKSDIDLFTAAWPLGAIAAVVILLRATASGWNGVFLAEIIRDVRPTEVGLAISGSLMFTYLGIVFGPSLFGALASVIGFPKAYIVMGTAVLLGGIFGTFKRGGRSDGAPAGPSDSLG
jgi:hypothetical protein